MATIQRHTFSGEDSSRSHWSKAYPIDQLRGRRCNVDLVWGGRECCYEAVGLKMRMIKVQKLKLREEIEPAG